MPCHVLCRALFVFYFRCYVQISCEAVLASMLPSSANSELVSMVLYACALGARARIFMDIRFEVASAFVCGPLLCTGRSSMKIRLMQTQQRYIALMAVEASIISVIAHHILQRFSKTSDLHIAKRCSQACRNHLAKRCSLPFCKILLYKYQINPKESCIMFASYSQQPVLMTIAYPLVIACVPPGISIIRIACMPVVLHIVLAVSVFFTASGFRNCVANLFACEAVLAHTSAVYREAVLANMSSMHSEAVLANIILFTIVQQ